MATPNERRDSILHSIQARKGITNFDEEISEATLKYTLSELSGGNLDEDIFQQLVEKMKEDKLTGEARVFNWRLLASVVIKAENSLWNKITEGKQNLNELQNKRREVEIQLHEAKQGEIKNQYGIAYNSTLNVTVVSVDLQLPISAKPYVKILVGKGATVQTDISLGNKTFFNQTYYLEIVTGGEQIDVAVFDTSSQQDQFVGSVSISLSLLKDQIQRQIQFPLTSINKQQTGTVTLDLLWLYSKEKPFLDQIEDWNASIQNQIQDIDFNESDLTALYAPFPEYSHQQIAYRTSQNYQIPQVDHQLAHQEQQDHKIDQKSSDKLIKITLKDGDKIGYAEVERGIVKVTVILFLLFCLITLLVHLFRPQFLDLLLFLTAIAFYDLNLFNETRAKVMLIILSLSILLDIGWFVLYTSTWWCQYSDQGPIEDWENRKFTVVTSYILFFLKFILAFALLSIYLQLKESLNNQALNKKKLLESLNFNRAGEFTAPNSVENLQNAKIVPFIQNQFQESIIQPNQLNHFYA